MCVSFLTETGYLTDPWNNLKFVNGSGEHRTSPTGKAILSLLAVITGAGLLIGAYATGAGSSSWLIKAGGVALGAPIGVFTFSVIQAKCCPPQDPPPDTTDYAGVHMIAEQTLQDLRDGAPFRTPSQILQDLQDV